MIGGESMVEKWRRMESDPGGWSTVIHRMEQVLKWSPCCWMLPVVML